MCTAESGGDPQAVGDGGTSEGLWQIHRPAHPEFAGWDLFDPEQNARAALQVWQARGNWTAWSTFTNGAYQAFLQGGPVAAAQQVVDGVSLAVASSSSSPWIFILLGAAALLVLGGRR